jgi:hypothetical protein
MRPRLPSLKPPSPESIALAGVGGLLLEGIVAAMLLFWFVDRYAPPQDLAWKPFSLDHPIGLATGRKLARISADPKACATALREGRVRFTPLPDKHDGFCSTVDGLRIQGGVTRLSPAGPVMTCKQALAFALFDRQVLQPAAREVLDASVVGIDHYGTYACRRIYGGRTGRVSEHAHANAFDLAGVVLDDGRRITVTSHFRAEDERGRFMRRVRDGACRVFRTTLSPDYNAAHRDHLHLDMGRFTVCR